MDRKRPQSFDDPFLTKESPNKKQNTFKSPQKTPPKSTNVTQNKLSPGTPTVTTRYGISGADASSLVDRIDTFATLIKCVAHVVENCGGSYEEDRNLGSYLIDAVNAVTGETRTRSLSTLKDSHFETMQTAGVFVDAGDIEYDPTKLPNIYNDTFEAMLSMFLRTSCRSSESGCRIIINAFIQFAIDAAITLNNLDYIAVFPEIAVSHPNIPSVGRVTGIIDHLVAKTGDRDPYRDGDIVSAMDPALAVIEAKKSDTVVQKSSASQLIAQLLCIQHKEYESRHCHLLNTGDASNEKRPPVGLLTDGEVWRIYFLQPYHETALMANEKLWEEGGELYISRKIYTNTEDGKKHLLGLLVHLISGFRPLVRTQDDDNHSMAPVWLQRKRKRAL